MDWQWKKSVTSKWAYRHIYLIFVELLCFVFACVHMCDRGQPLGVVFLLLPCEFQGLNPDRQAWGGLGTELPSSPPILTTSPYIAPILNLIFFICKVNGLNFGQAQKQEFLFSHMDTMSTSLSHSENLVTHKTTDVITICNSTFKPRMSSLMSEPEYKRSQVLRG